MRCAVTVEIHNTHDLGAKVRVTGTFTVTAGGAAVDPATIKLSVRPPSGSVVTYTYGGAEITRSSAGVYYADLNADQSGDWYYRWWSEGSGQAAQERRFKVRTAKAV